MGVALADALPQASRRDKRRLAFADALCHEYPLMLERSGVPADTCILAVRFGMDVAQVLGYRTRPLPVRVTAHNRKAVELRDNGLRPKDVDDHGDAYEVWLGYTPEEQHNNEKYNGHIIFVLDDKLAVDLTAHQLAVPERGLNIKALYFPVDREFLAGRSHLGLQHPEDGWRVIYAPHPEDKEWASRTDFRAKDYKDMHDFAGEMAKILRRRHGIKPVTGNRSKR